MPRDLELTRSFHVHSSEAEVLHSASATVHLTFRTFAEHPREGVVLLRANRAVRNWHQLLFLEKVPDRGCRGPPYDEKPRWTFRASLEGTIPVVMRTLFPSPPEKFTVLILYSFCSHF